MAATSHAPNPKPTLQLLKETNNYGAYSIREVFNELGVARDVLGGKSYVFYDLLIGACCELKRGDDAFECFDMMKGKGVIPCVHACNDILSLFLKLNTTEKAGVLKVEEGKGLYWFMESLGIKPNVVTLNQIRTHIVHSLVECARKENFEEASGMLEKMKEIELRPTAVTYNTLIDVCSSIKKAFSLHDEMMSKGIQPTHVTYTSLIYVLSKRDRMKQAGDLFEKIVHKGIFPDLIMFNALTDGHSANGNMDRAFALLKEMEQMKVVPDEVTYNILMQGRCREGKVEEARLCKNQEGDHAEQLLKEMVSKGIAPDAETKSVVLFSPIDFELKLAKAVELSRND
ncbi:hypothetical protein POTOM_033293 [Populus tomentosa]|uniref:PROP1-like PPR domain-containing protein n=1 Tax=Populus tomentosa TaxID=118781 RepID=A0A8X7Z060_POPTO|nr:hypothetical protein POTOM_033293 [Populus tomentosa]